MNAKRRLTLLALPILALMIAGHACGTGYRTTSRISGNSGEVRVRVNDADGMDNTSIEINEDWSWARITTTITLSVGGGSCRATLSGDDNASISLEATAGSPTEVYGDLVTDGFGEVDLQTDCQNAREVDLSILFTLK